MLSGFLLVTKLNFSTSSRCPLGLVLAADECLSKYLIDPEMIPSDSFPFLGSCPGGNRRGQSPVEYRGNLYVPLFVRPYIGPPLRLAKNSQGQTQAYLILAPASQRLAQASQRLAQASQRLAQASQRLAQVSIMPAQAFLKLAQAT